MSKKNFTGASNATLEAGGGINALLGEYKKPKRGRPSTQTKEVTKSSQQGTKNGETRATFIIKEELLESLKAIAYWERVLIKDVLNTAIEEAVAKYKQKHGAIKPIPKK